MPTDDSGMIDVRTHQPVQEVTFDLSVQAVMQCAVRDYATGDWYVSQASAGSQGSRNSTVINHCAPDGALIESMTLTDAGHGTFFGIETATDGTWLWLPWYVYDDSGGVVSRDVYRVLFRSGTFAVTDADITSVYPSPPNRSTQPIVDPAGSRVCLSISAAGRSSYHLYDLADIEAHGADATQIGATVGPVSGRDTIQGLTVCDNTLYRYSGTGDGSSTPTIRTYSFTDGRLIYAHDTSKMGRNGRGKYPGGFGEPESVFAHRDSTGQVTLYAGLTTRQPGSRKSLMFAFRPGSDADATQSSQSQSTIGDKIRGLFKPASRDG